MRVRITQLDGTLPNLALMKLSAWHRAQGDAVVFTRAAHRGFDDVAGYDRVYGSAIFSRTAPRVARFRAEFPDAIVGGTWDITNNQTIEELIGNDTFDGLDYAAWEGDRKDGKTAFEASIGFTARGCRLKCGFCVVPKKEGKPRSVKSLWDIWRGEPWPRHLHLLDNDFFGQEQWRERIKEARYGNFKICLNQGINTRLINEEAAEALASVDYRDDQFRQKRIYTAWDNIGDERVFFKGVDTLELVGIPPRHLLAYMLIGYDRRETWERLLYRFERMRERGIMVYPMVYGDKNRNLPLGGCTLRIGHRTLGEFQRWVIGRYYQVSSFDAFERGFKGSLSDRKTQGQLIFAAE
jgi:hypothetical protein